ncbi:CHAT domain-containing protein [Aquimarina amphilecti]|uniref:CHAT domain-containing protein n=1 Tax=Aquimarina amphilecti TaxID=1038014 RepID=A0A1H7MZ11_AQUAM|nr:CHAT domain-containing protein [Aquimarina amphilecti]SEL16576.1 CHAT domain-containing protein [Aquimarina amphilecti]
MKITLFFLLLNIIPFTIYSQQDKDEFNKLLNLSIDLELKKRKIDSFFEHTNEQYDIVLADNYHDYGVFLFKKRKKTNEIENLRKAILFTKKSLSIKDSLQIKSSKSLDKTLYNLGFFNSRIQEYFKAITYLIRLSETGQLDKKIVANSELSIAYKNIGDYHKALSTIEKAIGLCPNNSKYDKKRVNFYLLKADIYSSMGYKRHSNKIKSSLQKADSILQSVSYNPVKQKNSIFQIEGNLLLKTENYREAITNFSNAISRLHPLDSNYRAITHNSLGLAFLKIKQLDSSKLHLEEAIKYNPSYTPAYENLGDFYITKKEFKKGLLFYQKAIQYTFDPTKTYDYNDIIKEENLELIPNKYYTLNHLIQKANGWMQYYHHDKNHDHLIQALKTFKIADKLVDIIRFESSEYKSKLYWREQASSLYMKAVEVSFLLKKSEDAYYFMEKNKAILLLEDITNEQAKDNAKLPSELASREYFLKQSIYLSENKLNILDNTSKDSILAVKKEIYQHKRSYEVFVDSLNIKYPEYAINKQKVKVLPYSNFTTKFISDKEVVLQYILNDDQGYGILHTKGKSIFFEISNPKELIRDISIANHQVTTWFTNQQELAAYQKTAYRIFNQLIPEDVYSAIKEKNVTIIPDYALQQLSFETLITSEHDHSYLIKDTEIRYAYSMSYLDQNKNKNRNPELNFLGVAPIDFKMDNLGSLIHSKKEVTNISDIVSGDILLKEKSIKDSVISNFDKYNILHLSTHADVGAITNPWIAFRDQKMTLQEIYATKNQSEMVVLSACKTSLGKINKGEGVMSLARGFFYAGTNSVVSSLWSVNDKANQELMIDFYKNIDKGSTKSSALRNAKLHYLNTHDGSELSPFYWGSLILIGNNTPISLDQNSFKPYIVFILLMLVIGATSLYFFKKKNRKAK